MSNSFSIIVLITCLRSTTTHNYSGPVCLFFLSLINLHSIFVTFYSTIPQFFITLFGGLFGWNISVGFSIPALTFISHIGSHKNQLQIRCIERSPSLPALSLPLLLIPFPQQNTLSPTSETHTPQHSLHSLTTNLQLSKPSLRLSFSSPHFPASIALDPSLILNSRNPHEGIPDSQL